MDKSTSSPPQLAGDPAEAAVRYAEERQWDVLPGTWLETDPDGAPCCSCSAADCPAPGAHPTRPDWVTQASGAVPTVQHMWQKQPRASVLLPTGRSFDVLEVSENAGCLALARSERINLPLGPVLGAPGRRIMFFVLPGSGDKVPDTLRSFGCRPASLDLSVLGRGGWVVAPPTRTVPAGMVMWARRPTPANRWLPDATEALGALAYACAREAMEALDAGARPARPAAARAGAGRGRAAAPVRGR
ncbi:bifunctional DNA primase/polymerase [Streptomyces sp. NRRL F-5123]|uniref:bifunctional DNA primase/polymerase n=1 Tax=Streptomyces sp. NRRL F-5123 TaxID=1463856 RepID=UPI001F1B647A|nr:bifunctional DNA primase/polymerase [Streptomyces sp. NRRL F-5123]